MGGERGRSDRKQADTQAGLEWLRELYDYFAPAREEAKRYSEEEINADIDEAVKGVRRSHPRRP